MRNILLVLSICLIGQNLSAQSSEIILTNDDPKYLVVEEGSSFHPNPGDIIRIDASRTKSIKILNMEGTAENPITIINHGGQVNIHDTEYWGAIELKNCKHIIISGTGDPEYRYGFKLNGKTAGIGITEFSSDITIEFVEIEGIESATSPDAIPWTFFGIVAKKDFSATLPDGMSDYPTFDNLIIHDTYVHDVHEGMYLGETKSPGMKMTNMRVYNNIVTDTYKEAIQIANTVTEFEVYNNFMTNSGLEGRYGHTNLLQIGDNSQGRAFNNILIGCPGYGIICLGTGQLEFSNNYLENNLGVFCDDRDVLFDDAVIQINGNYFRNITEDDNDHQIVKYYNQYMELHIYDNFYNTDPIWHFLNSIVGPAAINTNNQLTEVNPAQFELTSGYFILDSEGPQEYLGMGPITESIPPPEIVKIILEPGMIQNTWFKSKDESGIVLVDEQDSDPYLSDIPVSKYWKPKMNNQGGKKNKGENNQEILLDIDLGEEYYLEEMFLYDLKKEGDITVSYYTNEEWVEIFSDPCINTNQWNQHPVQIKTNMLRLSVNKSYKGRVNEISLYGYKTGTGIKSGQVTSYQESDMQKTEDINSLKVFPNPASDWITIQSSFENISTEIIDTNGRIILNSNSRQIHLSDLPNGIYFVKVKNIQSGKYDINRLVVSH